MTNRLRADRLLVERGLFESRAKAQAAIEAGLVRANGAVVRKASDEIAFDAELMRDTCASLCLAWRAQAQGCARPFRLRSGGTHLVSMSAPRPAASRNCCWSAAPPRFTRSMSARGQLHAKLRGDSRVVSLEQTDIRKVTAAQLDAPAGFRLHRRELHPVEAGAAAGPRSGSAGRATCRADQAAIRGRARAQQERHRARHRLCNKAVCADIEAFVASLGWRVLGVIPSPIEGGDGNREFLLGSRA